MIIDHYHRRFGVCVVLVVVIDVSQQHAFASLLHLAATHK